ncbi:hypothetical protein IQ265_17065 [Nodosilinea sp. LEGE 06152]|uniref:hypothetical protein n=1 Tax=Nodosilinea sp. LEGE 06152 TaxID=2777966 RepID=UPI001882F96F|nr:hypothetical protein [Nodosilinea sp. LEGE 06152]MBE9158531.1 hypothetical protein [Nodosilinea sp. LEGE 06152]
MKLWLVCFLILFFGAEAAQWLGQLPWVGSTELSLPLTVAGGIGLAIASNYRHWPSLGASAEKAESPPLPTAPPPPSTPVAASAPPPKGSRSTDSISFEIKKPQGKKDEGM